VSSILNQDFKEFIEALNKSEVEYILVGGYSVIIHGYNRTTGDLDVWIKPTKKNYSKLKNAFSMFGMSVFDMTEESFLSNDLDVFTFGRPPVSIDILTSVKGIDFDETFDTSIITVIENVRVRVIHLNQLRKAKHAANRPKDQDDLLNLPED
jgi:hypothetical protein